MFLIAFLYMPARYFPQSELPRPIKIVELGEEFRMIFPNNAVPGFDKSFLLKEGLPLIIVEFYSGEITFMYC